jgi:hypothetical protein
MDLRDHRKILIYQAEHFGLQIFKVHGGVGEFQTAFRMTLRRTPSPYVHAINLGPKAFGKEADRRSTFVSNRNRLQVLPDIKQYFQHRHK